MDIIQDFLEDSERRSFGSNGDYFEQSRLHDRTHIQRCERCGKTSPSYYSTCKDSACNGRLQQVESEAYAGWLIWPRDMDSYFIAAPYAYGEELPKANWRTLEREIGELDGWEILYRPGFTTEGGIIMFDPADDDVVRFLAEARSALSEYPILDDDDHNEIRSEMMQEHLDNWMLSDFWESALKRIDTDTDDTDDLEQIEVLNELARLCCYSHEGYYSVDDMTLDDGVVIAFADVLAPILERIDRGEIVDVANEYELVCSHQYGPWQPDGDIHTIREMKIKRVA